MFSMTENIKYNFFKSLRFNCSTVCNIDQLCTDFVYKSRRCKKKMKSYILHIILLSIILKILYDLIVVVFVILINFALILFTNQEGIQRIEKLYFTRI